MIKKDKKLDENLECFCKIEDNKAQEKFDPETLEKFLKLLNVKEYAIDSISKYRKIAKNLLKKGDDRKDLKKWLDDSRDYYVNVRLGEKIQEFIT